MKRCVWCQRFCWPWQAKAPLLTQPGRVHLDCCLIRLKAMLDILA
jgi:hypothetical protein